MDGGGHFQYDGAVGGNPPKKQGGLFYVRYRRAHQNPAPGEGDDPGAAGGAAGGVGPGGEQVGEPAHRPGHLPAAGHCRRVRRVPGLPLRL